MHLCRPELGRNQHHKYVHYLLPANKSVSQSVSPYYIDLTAHVVSLVRSMKKNCKPHAICENNSKNESTCTKHSMSSVNTECPQVKIALHTRNDQTQHT